MIEFIIIGFYIPNPEYRKWKFYKITSKGKRVLKKISDMYER